MKKVRVGRLLFALMVVLLLVLAACNSSTSKEGEAEETKEKKTEEKGKEEKKEEKKDGLYSIDDFSNIKTSEGEAIDGGSFTFGLVSDSAFEGTLNWNFYSGDPDAQILDWFDEGLLDWDENYVYTNDGAATYEASEDGRVFTFKIRDNVNWHDGEPVTAEDWLFAHEVIGHPEYDGVRYGSDFTNIEGMEAYHNGEAETISGIKVIDDKTLEITYIESTPSLVTGGIWSYPLAKHIFGDMKVADISSSAEVREKPIGFGPFKVESIVPGESVVMSKNPDYWRGEPKLDEVTVKVINPNVVVQELETGGVDTVSSFPVDQYPKNAEMSNVEYLGMIDRAYTYIGFKLGTWDKDKKEVKPNPDAKMADVNLRKAMWHAVDNNAVGEKFYNGLRWNATTLIPPSHPEFHDETNPGVAYDPEAAKKILDEAGYEDKDGDGLRETPDGEELVINFASMSGGDTAEPLANYYIQSWKEVGLNVQLLDGRLQEFNTFYDRVGQNGDDDPAVDIYQGAWGVGIDVDPRGLYGRDALFNFTRYASEKNDELLAKGVSAEAFDKDYRKKVYDEWQQLMVDEIPVFPTLYRSELVPVNNRVLNFAIGDGTKMYKSDIAVTQEEPIVAE
ncbi:oligopeptide ABC transporter substrate-binding protein [Virgibacillus halodenitrificans]|uniref:oligopeptide ABC transporter substrate-binding protein n=1 Tax=Virgibacillus halodenitrificans TaxID=1482 RepID=UPI000316A79A|nr:oligopeptide ABC transporter substrate-binding protein [Virgibacillus halodenitrificans]MCG1026748.1 oligopeptide ABC transporter substrate-binding protein [Virgibacillus halodenitrificans]MEC2161066.1 oligopeptide ABC transporter substrate-binding protein [Virgibacillus halodenitrificans]MYL45856.1 oligopeptide ABC transporter substrate-binding protein [Virgibacillus halodenitrificans]